MLLGYSVAKSAEDAVGVCGSPSGRTSRRSRRKSSELRHRSSYQACERHLNSRPASARDRSARRCRRRPRVVARLASRDDRPQHVITLQQSDFRANLIERYAFRLNGGILRSSDRGIGAIRFDDRLASWRRNTLPPKATQQSTATHQGGDERDYHNSAVTEHRRQYVSQ